MEIAVNDLKILSLFAARDDVRYYLNCVRLVGQYAMATDGHRMTVLHLDEDSGMDVMVPIESVLAAIKCHAAIKKAGAVYPGVITDKVVITGNMVGSVPYKPIDGKYPDIGKAIPENFSAMEGSALSLQSAYWADYCKAAKIIAGSRYIPVVARAAKDTSAVLVSFSGDQRWFSICMQIKVDERSDVPTVPAWIREAFPRPTEEAKP